MLSFTCDALLGGLIGSGLLILAPGLGVPQNRPVFSNILI